MTDFDASHRLDLSAAQQEFILHWGEMSSRWGINRSMAQIHALLYVSEEPLNAEDIADTLQLARSNVSTSLRELQAWGIVRLVHRLGDRRDHFQTGTDVWEMLLTLLEQRKRREVDPTVGMLRDCLARYERAHGKGEETFALGRMRELLELLELLSGFYEQMRHLTPATQRRLLRMGQRLETVVGNANLFAREEPS